MAGTVAELKQKLKPDSLADSVSTMFSNFKDSRRVWEEESRELRDYIFATDTSTTSDGQSNSWSNKTHIPKITQIYDNLKANYMSALFPHDDWLEWEAGDQESASQEKRKAILAYMKNKLREGKFYTTVSDLIDDYILYGNVFADVEYVSQSKEDKDTNEIIPGFIGPRPVRYSPYDMVFNPLAPRFVDSPKITRSLWTIGEFKRYVSEDPEKQGWLEEALANLDELRTEAQSFSSYTFEKSTALSVDGFNNYESYLKSGYIEILEFSGDIYDDHTGTFLKDHIVTVADRRKVLRSVPNPSWLGHSSMSHVSWRQRPDNLWGMSPLANIVGMQYRINHLENSKADAIDLNIFPPIKVIGEVQDYEWGPGAEIIVDEGGDVQLLSPDLTAIAVDQEIQFLMDQMELFTGAPREAMGIRSPGEKTAFEVQSLITAASRIFQEKIRNFEINLLEPLLNSMLEVARRNLNGGDVVRVIDDDLGVESFISITKEDITAAGRLRPIGARHFARQAQLTQNLIGLTNSPLWPLLQPHFSRKAGAKLAEDLLGLERFGLFSENAGLVEDAESAQVAQELQRSIGELSEQDLDEGS